MERASPPRLRVVVAAQRGLLAHVADVFTELHAQGAQLVFAAKTRNIGRVKLPGGLLEQEGVSVQPLPLRRRGTSWEAVKLVRLLADYVRFLAPDLEGAAYPRRRIAARLRALGLPEDGPGALSADTHAWLQAALRRVERLLEPEPELEEELARLQPDAVLLVSRCSFGGFEPDLIKAARRLELPTFLLVWSWDNLSSKSVLHEHPDHLLVWNETQLVEAVELHGISPERVIVVGAPNFDRFFAEVASLPGRDVPRTRPTILYLGSSPNIAADETVIFARWLEAVRGSRDDALRKATIVVRPHPASLDTWRAWSPPDGVVVDEPAAKVDQSALARLVRSADVAVALNTSAEIEAAIAGCPVVTFRAGPDAPGQEGSLHFSHLLAAQGGFVVDATTLDEHVARVAAVIRGDYDREATDRFVRRFVRPRGIDAPVAPIVASTILELIGASRPERVGAW